MRIGPRHPWLGAAGFHLALPLLEGFYRRRHIHRSGSAFARARIAAIKDKIARGDTVTLAGVSAAGTHNSGVALVEVDRNGPRLIFNNEEERFSAVKHTNAYPEHAIAALRDWLSRRGHGPERIDAWFTSWDYAALGATLIRTLLEEAPASFSMIRGEGTPLFNLRDLDRGTRAARRIARQLGMRAGRSDRHAAPRQPRLVFLRGLAVRPRADAGGDRRARRARRQERDLALRGRARPHAAALQQ